VINRLQRLIYRFRNRRVRQKATPFSLFVTLLLFGLFFEAYMHNFNLVYITLFFTFAVAFSAGPMGMRNIKRVRGYFKGCGRVFAKASSKCTIKVSNISNYTAYAIDIVIDGRVYRVGNIEAQKSKLAHIDITAQKRGNLELRECILESQFPLSTVRFQVPLENSCKIVVYPTPKGKSLEEFLSKQFGVIGDEEDFDGIESYNNSAKASRIHWASIAKGELAIKTFSKTLQSRELEFDLNQIDGDIESRLSQLTLWILECEKEGIAFVVIIDNQRYYSREGIDEILTKLALYR